MKKRTPHADEWATTAAATARDLLDLIGADWQVPKKLNVGHLVSACVQIRNKTKAHGAVTEDFYNQANEPYIQLVGALIESCPAVRWRWLNFYLTPSDQPRWIELTGLSPTRLDKISVRQDLADGVYVQPEVASEPLPCGHLLHSDRQCRNFHLPNGGFNETSAKAEFLDYASGGVKQFDCSDLVTPPAPLPPSETHADFNLDIHSNVFGNLPPLPQSYVERKALQEELLQKLNDKNHPIITLHGRGGVGKTYLALFGAHELASGQVAPFEYVLWLRARDIDLRLHGPKSVKQDVLTLEDIASAVGLLTGADKTVESFAKLLQDSTGVTDTGVLLILDNFETLADVKGIYQFLDTHTHLPNKVLITSRERAFKADYPIEVHGMEPDEARQMLTATRVELEIPSLLTDDRIDELIDHVAGHAYALRVMAGEVAKEGRWLPLKSILPNRADVMQAVFERSFNRLSESARRVFLTVSRFRSVITELALVVVLGQRSIDVEKGIDECVRLSLIEYKEGEDGTSAFVAPQLARMFAQKKLAGDPDRLVIQEDLETIREFGIVKVGHHQDVRESEAIVSFLSYCASATDQSPDQVGRIASMLERVADAWPPAWLSLYELHQRTGASQEPRAYALRRAVEEMPYRVDAWRTRAEFAKEYKDEPTRIASLVSAVEADPSDKDLIRHVALELCRYMNDNLTDIPKVRRGVYLASVRSHMVELADELDATGLSRLAWLFLLEGDSNSAWTYANKGCALESTNTHCIKILERLDGQM
jgi:hypothetical protein